MTRKRETAAQRDERIVREAGPWEASLRWDSTGDYSVMAVETHFIGRGTSQSSGAAARILNRLRAPRGKRGGK